MIQKRQIDLSCIILVCLFLLPVFDIAAENMECSADELLSRVEKNQSWQITDEDFFGAYDDKKGQWGNAPMLDYKFSPKLRAVEHFAKKDDYDKAAEQLLKYYRDRDFRRQEIPASWHGGMVRLWSDNVIGFDQQEKLVNIIDLQKEPAECSVNVTATIRRGQVVFMLMGRHKNDSLSYVYSRESEYPPVLELKNGEQTKAIPASADIFIRAGKYGNENYGSSEMLEICNSGLKTASPFDDGTRRALISFDLSKIDHTKFDTAMLKIYAKSENDADSLILWRSYPTVINESKDCWNTVIGYQYSWENVEGGIEWAQPKGAHSQYPNWIRRLPWLTGMATASIRTGDPEVTKKTISMLRDFIEEYNYQPRPNGELNAGLGRMPNLCKYVPYLMDSEYMSPRDCVEIMKFLWKEGEYLYLNPSKLRRDNLDNMGMALVAAINQLTVTFPELSGSDKWRADGFERTEELMKFMVMDDGAYTEHTMGYPFAVLSMMLDMMEFSAERGASLPESVEFKAHQLARYLMNVSLPDGVPPRWGEGGPSSSKASGVVKRAAEYFNDKELKWWCGMTEEEHIPEYTSVHYPQAKIVMMRSGWMEDDVAMFFSPRVGGGHYHCDQNHICLSAYGSELLVDTGMSSYSGAHPHFDWQRHQTKSHNTVEVDEKGFPRLEDGRGGGRGSNIGLEQLSSSRFYVSDKVEYARGYGGGYPDIEHQRDVAYLKEPAVFIVADVLIPNDDKDHIYDQCWHLYPDIEFDIDQRELIVSGSRSEGANIILEAMYPSNARIIVRDGYNAYPLGDTRYPSFRQRKAEEARFYTMIVPGRAGERSDIKSRPLNRSESAHVFELQYNGVRGVYIHNTNPDQSISIGDLEVKASFAYITFDANDDIAYAVAVDDAKIVYKNKEYDYIRMVENKGFYDDKK